MPRVELARGAVEQLDRLVRTHSLPGDTRERFRRSLRPLSQFPMLGPELGGRWRGLRFMLGPWRWMIVVYAYIEHDDLVVVLSVEDARTFAAATKQRH